MPQVEETFEGYLSPGGTLSLKKPMLPTKLCRTTSTLLGKAFQAAGQAAMFFMERHLWLNLTGIKEKDNVFLIDAPRVVFWPIW